MNQDWLGLNRLPTLQRTAAIGLILTQHQTLKLLMEACPFPVAALSLAGWFAPQFGLLVRVPISVVCIAIASIFVMRSRTSDSDFSSMGFIGTEVAYHIACGCIAIQIAVLFLKRYETRLPIWILGISGVGMVLAGDIRVSGSQREVMLHMTAAYLTCWLLFAAATRNQIETYPRRGRWVRALTVTVTVLVAIAAGRAVAVAFHQHENQLERFVSALLFSRDQVQYRHGFSGGGGLHDVSSMRNSSGNEIALTITSHEEPGYLRGKVFDLFYRNRWYTTGGETSFASLSGVPNHDESNQLLRRFELRPEGPIEGSFRVSPAGRKYRVHCFAPLDTMAIQCNSNSLKIDPNGVIERQDNEGSLDYVVEVGLPSVTPVEDIDPKYLQVPAHVSVVAEDLADHLAQGKKTSAEKINAVSEFFQSQFTYELGIEVPRSMNRLDYFLANRVAAHCEYFATATAIILRLQGIPTRYVTGYVAADRNRYVGEWVVRSRDAHAWVEAYDTERRQWVIVESTPASGIPSDGPVTFSEELRDAVGYIWRKFIEFLTGPDHWSRLSILVQQSLTPIFVAVIGVLLIRRGLQMFFPGFLESRRAMPLARERIQMDRYLARRGFSRQKAETLLDFARRLEENPKLSTSHQMAEWYREYADIRFGSTSGTDDEILNNLRQKRQDLIIQTKVVS